MALDRRSASSAGAGASRGVRPETTPAPGAVFGGLAIGLSPRRALGVLLLAAVALTAASLLAQLARYVLDRPTVLGLVDLLDANREAHLPTWFSSLLLLASAVVLIAIARVTRASGGRYAGHWAALALLFVLLSADETAKVHELSTEPLRDALDTGGALSYAWVIPGAALAAACAALYARFLLALPRPVRRLTIVAAAVYLTAALGLELVEGLLGRWEEDESLALGLVGTAQEAGEMLGILVFLRAMALHLEALSPRITLGLGDRPQPERP